MVQGRDRRRRDHRNLHRRRTAEHQPEEKAHQPREPAAPARGVAAWRSSGRPACAARGGDRGADALREAAREKLVARHRHVDAVIGPRRHEPAGLGMAQRRGESAIGILGGCHGVDECDIERAHAPGEEGVHPLRLLVVALRAHPRQADPIDLDAAAAQQGDDRVDPLADDRAARSRSYIRPPGPSAMIPWVSLAPNETIAMSSGWRSSFARRSSSRLTFW